MYSCLENLASLEHSSSAPQPEGAVGLWWETSEQHSGATCVGPGCAIVFSRIKTDDDSATASSSAAPGVPSGHLKTDVAEGLEFYPRDDQMGGNNTKSKALTTDDGVMQREERKVYISMFAEATLDAKNMHTFANLMINENITALLEAHSLYGVPGFIDVRP